MKLGARHRRHPGPRNQDSLHALSQPRRSVSENFASKCSNPNAKQGRTSKQQGKKGAPSQNLKSSSNAVVFKLLNGGRKSQKGPSKTTTIRGTAPQAWRSMSRCYINSTPRTAHEVGTLR